MTLSTLISNTIDCMVCIAQSVVTKYSLNNVFNIYNVHIIVNLIIAGSLESLYLSILASCDHFKDVVGEKNQGFIIIRFFNPSDLIGCGGV